MSTATSPWKATANNKTASDGYAIPPEDNHGAVLVAIVDLGTHGRTFDKTDKDGKPTGQNEYREYRQLFLAWELTDCPDPDHKGRNFVIGKEYSLSLGVKSALRGVVEIWKGRKLQDGEDVNDLDRMLGAKFMIDVVHGQNKDKTRTYANIKAVTSVPKKLAIDPPLCKPYLFALDGKTKFEPPSWLPQYSYGEKLADKISASKEVKGGTIDAQADREAEETFNPAEFEGDIAPQ